MGYSDHMVIPKYKSYIGQLIANDIIPDKGIKIAWLGQQDPNENPLGNLSMYNEIVKFFNEDCSHCFYDIRNKKSWNAHEDWGEIKGYDLILALRLNYLIPSVKHMLKETRKVIENNNAKYVTDFCSGNVQANNTMLSNTISWKKESKNMIAYLPEYWARDIARYGECTPVASEDNILTRKKIEDAGLVINRFFSYRCPKNRFNTVCTLEKL